MENVLIVIRGNSGSGKSTTAKKILEKLPNIKIVYIEQDYVRRTMLRERGSDSKGKNIKLIEEIIRFSLKEKYDVILEGILLKRIYGKMFKKLNLLTKNIYFFYFDIPYSETFKRHKTKNLSKEIPDEKHKEWFIPDDKLNVKNEFIINESMSLSETVDFIICKSKLDLPTRTRSSSSRHSSSPKSSKP